jgi:hypothetical protein
VDKSSWLTIGKDYLVLEVVAERSETKFRVISDDAGTPILARSSQFEIISEVIPKCWVETSGPGSLTFSPAAFQETGFWERYFDGDKAARLEFVSVVKLITQDS